MTVRRPETIGAAAGPVPPAACEPCAGAAWRWPMVGVSTPWRKRTRPVLCCVVKSPSALLSAAPRAPPAASAEQGDAGWLLSEIVRAETNVIEAILTHSSNDLSSLCGGKNIQNVIMVTFYFLRFLYTGTLNAFAQIPII